MREILFRGQTRRKGEKVRMDGSPVDSNWVYGGILPGEGDRSIIYQTEPEIDKFPVYSDTVGQYTGLKDKNGTRIFEGDILIYVVDGEYDIDEKYLVVFDDDEAAFKVRFYYKGKFACYDDIAPCEHLEVIGNIYDNPELLKGESNDKQKS